MSTETPVCGCIELLEGFYVQRCDCGNSGDLMTATMWCAEKNDEPMKDAIRRENARLREELADRSSIRCANCHINPDMECEPLKQCRGELAEAKREIDRLNKWADSFTDAHLKERQTGDALVKETMQRAEQAEARALAAENALEVIAGIKKCDDRSIRSNSDYAMRVLQKRDAAIKGSAT